MPELGSDANQNVYDAIALLRTARTLLVRANAPRAADKVRAAIKSAEGAARNATCRTYRTRRPTPSAFPLAPLIR